MKPCTKRKLKVIAGLWLMFITLVACFEALVFGEILFMRWLGDGRGALVYAGVLVLAALVCISVEVYYSTDCEPAPTTTRDEASE